MHSLLIAKVKADDAGEAKARVESLLNESVSSEENTVGWDYVGDCEVITKEELSPNWGVKSFKELEKKYTDARKESIAELKSSLRDQVVAGLVPRHMPLEEAPLHLHRKNQYGNECPDMKNAVEKLLKSKKGGKLPKSFEELETAFLDMLESISKDEIYYLKKMERVYKCIEFPEDKYITLQASDNHFADLTEDTDGDKIFYVATDRHM